MRAGFELGITHLRVCYDFPMKKPNRVNIRISRKAFLALQKKAAQEDTTIISVVNILCGV